MDMEYRRLGRSGLQVSVLSFGSWVTFGPQLDRRPGRRLPGRRLRRRRQLLRQRRGLRRRASPSGSWARPSPAGLAPPQLRRVHQAVLGPPRRPSTCATRSTASTCSRPSTARSSASGSTSSTSSSATAPTPRRRSRRRCGPCRTSSAAARRSTGAPRSGRRRRSARPGTSPSATTCTSRSWSSPSTTCFARDQVEKEYARLYDEHRPRPHHLEPAGLGPAHRQVPRRHPRGQPGRPARLRVAAGTC